jgi:hypothetical protein
MNDKDDVIASEFSSQTRTEHERIPLPAAATFMALAWHLSDFT